MPAQDDGGDQKGLSRIHGTGERMSVETLERMARFYAQLLATGAVQGLRGKVFDMPPDAVARKQRQLDIGVRRAGHRAELEWRQELNGVAHGLELVGFSGPG